MKLAEALSIRKDLQKRIQQLGQRIQNNVKVQEGDAPSEEPTELMKELDACLTQLEDLIWRINATNMKTTNAQGVTLTQLMARKDVLTMRVSNLRSIFDTASAGQDRYSRSEIKTNSTWRYRHSTSRPSWSEPQGIRVCRANRTPTIDRCPEPAAPVHDEQHGAGSARCHPNVRLRPHGALPTG